MCTRSRSSSIRGSIPSSRRVFLKRWRRWQRALSIDWRPRAVVYVVCSDPVIPRTRLPEILETIHAISKKYRVVVCNVFHAGDGNLHPNIAYSADDPDESERVHKAMTEIMRACIDAGGSITGEHGVGLDKMGYMESIFSENSLNAMCELRGVFDPERRSNPGKVIPIHSCKEWNAVARKKNRLPHISAPAHADDDLPGGDRSLEAEPSHPSAE